MSPEERRELEKLAAKIAGDAACGDREAERLGEPVGYEAGWGMAMRLCDSRLRATLDRLTDEQSEPTTEDEEEVMPDDRRREEASDGPDVEQGERVEGRLVFTTRSMGTEQRLNAHDDMVTNLLNIVNRLESLHRSPEPPDSTEFENDGPAFPDQPLHRDPDGAVRFRKNAIVRFLLDRGGFDLNDLWTMPFSDEDRMQFAQLIGYSVGGYGELSYVSDEAWERAEKARKRLHDTGILTTESEG